MVISLVHKHKQILAVLVLIVVVLAIMAVHKIDQASGMPAASSAVSTASVISAPSSTLALGAAPVQATPAETQPEMRAVWVTYMDLDMSGASNRSQAAFQKKYDAIVQNAKARGMNALIVHVRPFSDAMYPSKLYPWSHLVGGTQGVNPGFDPLAYMVEATHQAGLQFHAWVNPMRVTLNGLPSILSENNPWNVFRADPKRKDWAIEYKKNKYLDPGWSGVRDYIVSGIQEIVQNYDVDGVQFDDYFYPDENANFDKASYAAYCKSVKGSPLSLEKWRCENINVLLKATHQAVKAARPDAVFGVSPQGNLKNDLKMGADVSVWCQNSGYVDYICPQLYYNYDNPVLPYASAAKTWKDLVTAKNVKLYFGLGLYKTDTEADKGAWKNSTDTMARQVETGRSIGCNGFMFYAYEDLVSDNRKQEVQNMMKLFT